MAFVKLQDGDLHYQIQGPASAPVLVLSHSLGTDLHMWDAQVASLSKSFRVVRYDTRGHGESLVTQGPYTIEQLGRDVLTLLDTLKIEKAHFCGLSMGGLIGQWLGVHANERLHKLILCNTAAKIGGPDIWGPRIETVEKGGEQAMKALCAGAVERWFTPDFAREHADRVTPLLDVLAATSPLGYAACCAAVRDADFRKQVTSITAPTLIVCGSHDSVATVADGHYLQNHIQGSQLSDFYAAHLSSVELGEVFTLRVTEFLLS
ncbi:3-oxoadipate enol-lactonase [Pseudomonas sp. GD03842]|uniref:3-oxoadipate enol-lactonase n=1 Tax=Pseudomonas sp. GD03842 TaxID=2975385 RepID=UPI00244D49B6|nr:3-oxoadipate enol-lactonase [Pseudomonas sp. GD03842]MDH0748473.1 3-oxoadipate enol-lactonase [Pseudomonas sp. GD03842]